MLTWWAGGVQSTTGLFCGAGWEELFSFECESDQRGGDRLQKEDEASRLLSVLEQDVDVTEERKVPGHLHRQQAELEYKQRSCAQKRGVNRFYSQRKLRSFCVCRKTMEIFFFYQWVVLSAVYFIAASEKTVSVPVTGSKLDTFETCKKCFTSCDHRLHHSLDRQPSITDAYHKDGKSFMLHALYNTIYLSVTESSVRSYLYMSCSV